jgi:hypothetical protein
MAMWRSDKVKYSAKLHAPVSLSCEDWILWKPGVDPTLLYRRALQSFKTKRRVKIATVFAPIPLLVVAAILIDSLLIRIPAQVWVVVAFGLVFLAAYTFSKWDKIERRSRVGRFDEFAWIDSLAGSQCMTRHTSRQSPPATRIVRSLAAVADSRALAGGWINHGDVLQLHEIAWECLTENHALNILAQSQLLDETATTLERTATETKRIDAKLRDLEKSAELGVLNSRFQIRQSRAEQIFADFEARLRFLNEQDRSG